MLMPDPTTAAHRSVLRAVDAGRSSATSSSRSPASPTTATRARSPRRPRPIVKSTGIGDTVYFGPEAEFFMFDDVTLHGRPVQHRLQARRRSSCRPTPTPTTRGGNLGHRSARQGRLLPGPAGRLAAGHARRDARRSMAEMGVQRREAPPRGRRRPARARPEVRHAGHAWPTTCRSTSTCIHKVATCLRQDGDLHAEADLRRQRLGHARPPVDLEGRQAAVRRQRAMPTCRRAASTTSAASSSTPRRSTPSPTRRPTPTSVWCPGYEAPVLLAYSARNRSASCRIPFTHQPEGQARRSPLPRSGREPLPRLRGAADGRPRRHQEQDPSRASRWTRTSTTCRRRS